MLQAGLAGTALLSLTSLLLCQGLRFGISFPSQLEPQQPPVTSLAAEDTGKKRHRREEGALFRIKVALWARWSPTKLCGMGAVRCSQPHFVKVIAKCHLCTEACFLSIAMALHPGAPVPLTQPPAPLHVYTPRTYLGFHFLKCSLFIVCFCPLARKLLKIRALCFLHRGTLST